MNNEKNTFQATPECREIFTSFNPINEITSWNDAREDLRSSVKTFAWVYLIQQNQVLLGKWNGTDFSWPQNKELDSKYIIELVVFNENMEWRLVQQSKGVFTIRLAIDTETTDISEKQDKQQWVMDQRYLMYGTPDGTDCKGWTSSFESRGGELILPFKASGKKRIWCKIRNYFVINDAKVFDSEDKNSSDYTFEWSPSDGILFTDYRLCGFLTQSEDEAECEEVECNA